MPHLKKSLGMTPAQGQVCAVALGGFVKLFISVLLLVATISAANAAEVADFYTDPDHFITTSAEDVLDSLRNAEKKPELMNKSRGFVCLYLGRVFGDSDLLQRNVMFKYHPGGNELAGYIQVLRDDAFTLEASCFVPGSDLSRLSEKLNTVKRDAESILKLVNKN